MVIDVEQLYDRRADNRWDRTCVGDVLERVTWSRPDRVAITGWSGAFATPEFERLTYREADEVVNRVAQGLLSTLRDFGVLEGAAKKHIAPPRLSLRGFTYVAVRERGQHPSGRALLQAPVWRRYLLDAEHVRALFLDADRHKVLRFSEAGSAVRIDWLIAGLEEVPRVAAA